MPQPNQRMASKLVIAVALLLASATLLFARLGHYPLWDDEADTGLYGLSVWRTGDTSARLGHNLIAFRSGKELTDLHNRYLPPLGYYVCAPFVGLLGRTAFAARLPFVLFGLATVVLLLVWLRRENAGVLTWLLMGLAVVGNVSFFLFMRQARYYAVSTFASALIVYLYLYRREGWRNAAAIGLLLVMVLGSNYLQYGALVVCLLADYVIWGRRERWATWREWVALLLPQLLLGGFILLVWNPMNAAKVWDVESPTWLRDRFVLLAYQFRDMNGCEFGVGLLILLAPFVAAWTRDRWLARALLALVLYAGVIGIGSPQEVHITGVANVRYLVPLIPLLMFIGLRVILRLSGRRWSVAVPLAVVAFLTTALHGGPYAGLGARTRFDEFLPRRQLRSTLLKYVEELRDPLPSGFAMTIHWIQAHMEEGQSVWVSPNYAVYPLMYHAPRVVYAWQLLWPPEPQFEKLDSIHFFARSQPDYAIVFGPVLNRVTPALKRLGFRRVKVLDVFWADLNRPELFYHAFEPIRDFDRSDRAVYVYECQGDGDSPSEG